MPEMELVDSVPAAPAPTPAPETPSPAPEAAPEVKTPEPAPEVPVEPQAPQLYRLPDGRQVDSAGLQREYENLLPEFTRKSQELAALKTQNPPITKETPPWKDPNFQPNSWADAIEIAKAEALAELGRNAEAARAEEAAVRANVESQLVSIKAVDPKIDENALFEHATKYGFTDLNSAYTNFKAINDAVAATEKRVTKNLTTRAADPIATTPTPAPVAKQEGLSPARIGQFRGALDFLESIKHKN